MQAISIFGLGIQSRSPNVTAQTRVNMYLEFEAQGGDKTQVTAYGTPGLELFANLGTERARGMYAVGVYNYIVTGNKLWRVNQSGNSEFIDYLNTGGETLRVGMADNGLQLRIDDGENGYIYTYATGTFEQITDPDFVPGNTVSFNDGFFISNEPGSGRFWLSKSYDGLVYDALDFATAESNPDNLVYPYPDHGEIILFGEIATEFLVNTGALDFPYARIAGSAIEWGLAARWSVTKFDNSVIFLAQNRLGEVQVTRINGYTPKRVSTFDLEAIINAYPFASIKAASGYSYMYKGHPFYVLNFTEASWLYDGASNAWSQLKSYGLERHRGQMAVLHNNQTVVADFENGNLYLVKGDVYTDNGDPLISELTTRHTFRNGDKLIINELWVDSETGSALSTGQGSDPQISMQISKDGGHSWGNERFASMGKLGEYKARTRWLRLGQARDWVFRLTISEPIKRVLLGAWVR